jgi:ABC-2 type transport system permease protein
MRGMRPLLKKEILEQLRTYRLLIVGGIFLFFGLSTPILLKYLPEIIKLAGEQIPVEIPPPTAIQSLAEFAGTIGQIGVLVAVLVSMGVIANELKNGTAFMTLSKPVTHSAFVNAKFIAMSLTFIVSLILSALCCYAYTVWIIGPASFLPFIAQTLLLGLFLLFCLAVTVLFSSFFKSSLAAGGLAIAVIIGQQVISSIPYIGNYFPGKILSWGNNLLNGSEVGYTWALIITIVLICLCLYLAQRALKYKEM